MNEMLYYDVEEELHPLELNLTKLICNRINEPEQFEIANEFMIQWKEIFIERLNKNYSENDSDKFHWKMMKNEHEFSNPFKKIVSDKIFGHDDLANEFIIDLRLAESVYLTKNICLNSDGKPFKIINSIEVDKYQLSIAMLSKLIEVDVLDMKAFLDFQLDANFNNNVSEMKMFLTNIILKYGGKNNYLGDNQISAIEHWVKNDVIMKKIEMKNERGKSGLVWQNEKGYVQVHFIKFLIKEYLDKDEIVNEDINNFISVLLNNKIASNSSYNYKILSGNKDKVKESQILKANEQILLLLENLELNDNSKHTNADIIDRFKEYWKYQKFT